MSISVLHLYSSTGQGGGAQFVRDLITESKSKEWPCFLATRKSSKILELIDLPSTNIATLPLKNGFDLVSIFSLVRYVKRHSITIIHAHTGRDYSIALLVARITKTKCVFHRHYYKLSKNPFTRFLYRRADAVITVNSALRESLINDVHVHNHRAHSLANWIEVKAFTEPRETASVIAMAGQVNANKAQLDFIKAALITLKKIDSVVFYIIGADDASKTSDYYAELLTLINENNIEDRVHLIDWQADLSPYYQQADIWVVPSHNEAFGRVAIEAMSFGLPVVVSGVGGLREIIDDGETGMLFTPKNHQALADKLCQLINHSDLRMELAQNGYEHVCEQYSAKHVMAKLETIYSSLA